LVETGKDEAQRRRRAREYRKEAGTGQEEDEDEGENGVSKLASHSKLTIEFY
jgi:hypothetical protein